MKWFLKKNCRSFLRTVHKMKIKMELGQLATSNSPLDKNKAIQPKAKHHLLSQLRPGSCPK